MVFRSGSPKPPSSFGRHAIGHDTRHLPPWTVSVPAQRNARRRLSISRMAHDDRAQQIDVCTGIADKVDLTKVALPTEVSLPGRDPHGDFVENGLLVRSSQPGDGEGRAQVGNQERLNPAGEDLQHFFHGGLVASNWRDRTLVEVRDVYI